MAAAAENLGDVLAQVESAYNAIKADPKKRPSGAAISRWINDIVMSLDKRTSEKRGLTQQEMTQARKIVASLTSLKASDGSPLALKGKAPHNIHKEEWERLSVALGVIPSGQKIDLVNNLATTLTREPETPEQAEDVKEPEGAGASEPEGERLIDPSDPRKTVDIINPKSVVGAKAPVTSKFRNAITKAQSAVNEKMKEIGTEQAKRVGAAYDAASRILKTNKDSTGGVDFFGVKLPAGLFKSSMKMNYCGAGTNVVENILKGVQPANELDAACMEHDLLYYQAGAIKNKKIREKLAIAADEELIRDATRISQTTSDDVMKREAEKVSGMMTLKSYIASRDAFIAKDPPPLSEERRAQIKEFLARTAIEARELAGDGSLKDDIDVLINTPEMRDIYRAVTQGVSESDVFADFPTAEETREAAEAAAAAKAEAAAAAKAAEAGAEGGVSETAPVLTPAVERAAVPPQAPERPRADEVPSSMEPIGIPIVGERSMRPMAFRMEGDEVTPTEQQVRQNQLWLENFTWIDEGHGLGNQERLPWNLGGGAAKNSLFRAQKINEAIRYGGELYNGEQEIREVKPMSASTRRLYRQPMMSTNMRQQEFVRNGPMPAGLGRKIQMYRDTQTTPYDQRNNRSTHLIHGDVVDGKRI